MIATTDRILVTCRVHRTAAIGSEAGIPSNVDGNGGNRVSTDGKRPSEDGYGTPSQCDDRHPAVLSRQADLPSFVAGRVVESVEPHPISKMDREVGCLAIYGHSRYRPRRDKAVRLGLPIHRGWKAKLLPVILVRKGDPAVGYDAPGARKGNASTANQVGHPIGLPVSDVALMPQQFLLKPREPIETHGAAGAN